MKNKNYDKKFIPAKYIQRYFALNCSAEMQELKLFPNIKEITEAFSIFNAIEKYILTDNIIKRDEQNTQVWVIGDGHTPRCGALIALMTKWEIISIDPEMRYLEKFSNKIKRLTLFNSKLEDIDYESIIKEKIYENTIIVLPHSHIISIRPFWNKITENREKVWLINMPCCVPSQDDCLKSQMNYLAYKDKYNISAKNEIRIFCNYKNLNYENN